jgi:hypothetical protein
MCRRRAGEGTGAAADAVYVTACVTATAHVIATDTILLV